MCTADDRRGVIVLRRRRVRIHQLEGPTVEGILVSSLDGHYRLLKASIIRSEGSVELEGQVWVPREKVILVETVRS